VARFIYGGYLVLAVAAMMLSWRLAPSALIATSVIVLVFATIVTLLTQGLSRRNTYSAAPEVRCRQGHRRALSLLHGRVAGQWTVDDLGHADYAWHRQRMLDSSSTPSAIFT
jgi:hypothetical protein